MRPGRYTFYRLTKQDLGTLEAVEAICRRWNLSGRRVSYAGLKDRHAATVQYLTIVDGPSAVHAARRNSSSSRSGRLAAAVHVRQLIGNRFELVLRDLIRGARRRPAASRSTTIPSDGLPNYFDDQRFGSVGYSGEFVAHAWLRGDHERALRLALAEPNPFDRSATKAEKAILRSSLGRLGRGEAAPAPLLGPQHRDLPGRPSDRLPRRLRPAPARAPDALFLGVPEPPLEPDARRLARVPRASPIKLVAVELKVGTFPFPRRARARTGPQL